MAETVPQDLWDLPKVKVGDIEAYQSAQASAFRRLTHPWEFPDRNPFPHIDPVPWLTSRILRWRAFKQRVRDAREVLRYGLDDTVADRW